MEQDVKDAVPNSENIEQGAKQTNETSDSGQSLKRTEEAYDEQKLKAELLKKEELLNQKFNELKLKERELKNREMQNKAQEKLKKSSIPEEALYLVKMDTEESMEKSIAVLERLLKRSSEEAPAIGSYEESPLNYKQRAALYLRNNY